MKNFEPSLFDKLFPKQGYLSHAVRKLNVEELKEVVARDIEALLNTRMVFTEEMLSGFKECQRSILTYGVSDFSGKSLVSFYDRSFICRSLEQALARHEPRLKNVNVTLGVGNRITTAVLFFEITAVLDVGSLHEPVAFDATLKPSTLQYVVSNKRNSGLVV